LVELSFPRIGTDKRERERERGCVDEDVEGLKSGKGVFVERALSWVEKEWIVYSGDIFRFG